MSNRFLPGGSKIDRLDGRSYGGQPSEPAPMERRLAELNNEDNKLIKQELIEAKVRLHRKLIDDLNLPMVERLTKEELRTQVSEIVTDYVRSERILLNARELENFIGEVIDELTGLGPIEPLLKDPTISDILINTHEKVMLSVSASLSRFQCASRTRRMCCASSTKSSALSAGEWTNRSR